MVTQRKRNPTRRGGSPMSGNERERIEPRGRSRGKGSDLTTILVILLVFAFVVLFGLIYLAQNKNKQVATTPVPPPPANPAPTIVQTQKEQEPIVEESPKKKPKAKPKEPAKRVNVEVVGEKTKEEPVETHEPAEVKPKQKNDDDAPVQPKSFMGGLSNPEMEQKQGNDPDKDKAREERRKKIENEALE